MTMTTDSIAEPTTLQPGVEYAVAFTEYAAWQAVNWHLLEPFRISAKQGRQRMLAPQDASDTMVFGAAFHSATLEPKAFDEDYAVMPVFTGHPNSNAHKEAKAAWQAANATKVHLSPRDRDELLAMSAAVRAHPKAAAILGSKVGRNELSIRWRDRGSGVLCKGRVDRLCRVPIGVLDRSHPNPDAEVICAVDMKTTRSIEEFEREAAKYAYHGQMAFYRDGLMSLNPAALQVIIIAVENHPPFDVLVYRCDEDLLDHGRRLYRRLLTRFIGCEQHKRWPGISDDVLTLFLPEWAKEPGDDLEGETNGNR